MRVTLLPATDADAAELAALHCAVADDLTRRFGKGHWSSATTEKGVRFSLTRGRIYLARSRGRVVATLTLSTRKPWAIDRTYFTPCRKPLYLTNMAVAPSLQRRGLGTQCVEQAIALARAWPGDAICLDAYDAAAGAGEFYRKTGFTEVGRVVYRGTPLIYFERLLT